MFAASSVVAGVIVRASFWSGSPQGALAHQSTSDTAPSNMSREFTFSDWHQSAGLAVEAPRVLDVRVDVWADDFWQESAEVPGQVRPWPPDWQKSHLWLNGSRTESGHTYPVSKASFERSFYPPSQEWLCRWRRLVDALNAGHNATMCVVGGSMTAGHGVNHKKGETWTQHVAVWLRATFPGWSLSVENRAVPAQSAGELANFHADKLVGCDAYVIDTGVNARRLQTLGMVQAGEDSLLHLLTSRSSRAAAQPPPILYAHAFDFCFGQCGCEKNSEAVEVLRDYKGRAFAHPCGSGLFQTTKHKSRAFTASPLRRSALQFGLSTVSLHLSCSISGTIALTQHKLLTHFMPTSSNTDSLNYCFRGHCWIRLGTTSV